MKYRITNLVRKETSTGKPMIKCDLTTEDGATTTQDVAIWSTFANFDNLKDEDVVEGELDIKQNGQYTNKNLKSPTTGNIGANRGGQIAKAQEKKAEYIERAQENKEEGIKISATMRDAVLCAIAEYNKDPHNLDTLEELIRKWRKVLWFEWDSHNTYPPFVK